MPVQTFKIKFPTKGAKRDFRNRAISYKARVTGKIRKFGRARTKAKRRAPSKSFQKQMKLYNNLHTEKKFIPMNNRTNGPAAAGYLQDCPAVSIPNAGLTGANDGLSAIVLQTGKTLTNANSAMNTSLGADLCYPMGGYDVTRGTGAVSDIIGNYVNFTSSFINVNISIDPASGGLTSANYQEKALPRQFRLIIVKAKRQNSVAGGGASDQSSLSPALQTNLFIDEINQEKGLLDAMSCQDAFTWLINKQKYQVLKEERFVLTPNAVTSYSSGSNLALNNAVGPNGTTSKSQRFKKYYLPVPKNKTKFDTAHATIQPVDFNYITHTIILCKSMGGQGNPDSRGWAVQGNGATAFLDE